MVSAISVDLLVRSWVEILQGFTPLLPTSSRPPREVVSWNNISIIRCTKSLCRPPREVVSWNIISTIISERCFPSTSSWGRELKYQLMKLKSMLNHRRPPREVVSWNNTNILSYFCWNSRPPREVVSWNEHIRLQLNVHRCRPPREVVSWNLIMTLDSTGRVGRPPREVVSWNAFIIADWYEPPVDLLVRSWVEILTKGWSLNGVCVDLLVRSWVEMLDGR